MSGAGERRAWRRWAVRSTLLVLLGGCGLTVTNEKPPYQDLDNNEKSAVDIIISELTAFNQQVKARTKYHIDQLMNRENIDVSFEEFIFAANLGDDQVHISTWENLSSVQHSLIQTWFKSGTQAAATQSYKKFFYRFLAVSQGAKQFMYNSLGTQWVFTHRSLFNVERDTIRTALAHYVAVGRQAEMWNFLSQSCSPIISQYGPTYGPNFNKQYLNEHFTELADGAAPTGYMYFICRWIQMGKEDVNGLTAELNWLLALRK